ncbi:carboxymuconolactone decarboxylase family protein [Antrihabitans cavernicola]|uniref:Carboxymuconolactone decarboxylase family protein n=1 Tax=Antrihabitans cavernicola TaxID=2495913 RepID=A0A5A7S426_9NOCA|nr:carboxymuconolactone decarboxylase family protein [Spelaeibacter cavernicola]
MTDDPSTPVIDHMRSSGQWNPQWNGLAEMDPGWIEQYMTTATQPWRSDVLSPKVIELLCIAVDAACTHMYAPGVRRHIRAALELGVSGEEILEVLKLATVVGIHSCNIGVPILVEELQERASAGSIDDRSNVPAGAKRDNNSAGSSPVTRAT